MKWQWNGRALAAPHTIARRLLARPALRPAQMLVVLATAAGWGMDEARRAWRQME